MKAAVMSLLVVGFVACGAQQPKTPGQQCRERATLNRIGRSANPDPRLDALEDIRCDEIEREERREAREDRRREEDRQERTEARREVIAAVAPPATKAAALPDGAVVDLRGLWMGDYGGGRLETVKIEQDGPSVAATKVTGDSNVPAGKPTFRATLIGAEGDGAGHAGDPGYANPRWYPGHLRVLSAEEIEFAWTIPSGGFVVRYKRLKP